jgi:hypothetical protein
VLVRKRVPVCDLVDDPALPPRLTRGVERLAAAIEEDGLLQPPVVRALENGLYGVILGRRRRAALVLLRDEWVETEVVVVEADAERVRAMVARERASHEELPALERAWQVKSRSAEVETGVALAREAGVTPGAVSQLCTVADAFPDLEDLAGRGVPAGEAAGIPLRKLREIAAVTDRAEQTRRLRVAAGIEEDDRSSGGDTTPSRATLEAVVEELRDQLADARGLRQEEATRSDRLLRQTERLGERLATERTRSAAAEAVVGHLRAHLGEERARREELACLRDRLTALLEDLGSQLERETARGAASHEELHRLARLGWRRAFTAVKVPGAAGNGRGGGGGTGGPVPESGAEPGNAGRYSRNPCPQSRAALLAGRASGPSVTSREPDRHAVSQEDVMLERTPEQIPEPRTEGDA